MGRASSPAATGPPLSLPPQSSLDELIIGGPVKKSLPAAAAQRPRNGEGPGDGADGARVGTQSSARSHPRPRPLSASFVRATNLSLGAPAARRKVSAREMPQMMARPSPADNQQRFT